MITITRNNQNLIIAKNIIFHVGEFRSFNYCDIKNKSI